MNQQKTNFAIDSMLDDYRISARFIEGYHDIAQHQWWAFVVLGLLIWGCNRDWAGPFLLRERQNVRRPVDRAIGLVEFLHFFGTHKLYGQFERSYAKPRAKNLEDPRDDFRLDCVLLNRVGLTDVQVIATIQTFKLFLSWGPRRADQGMVLRAGQAGSRGRPSLPTRPDHGE